MIDFKENFEIVKKFVSEKAERVGKKTGEVVETVAQKAEQTVEVQKIKNQIRVMEKNNERDYAHIGKMVYNRFKKDEVSDEAFKELCENIAARDASIDKLRNEIAEVKGLDVCSQCGEHVEPRVSYCPKCGAKVDGEVEFEEE